MATLNEILAAKAAAKKANVTPPVAAPEAAVGNAPTRVRGIKLSPASDPLAGFAGREVAAAEAELLGKLPPTPQERSNALATSPNRPLGQERDDVPYEFPSETNSPENQLWTQARTLPLSSLGVVMDTDGEHAWLALTHKEFAGVLLLHRLPKLSQREPGQPF
jgi:hypothetical protein